MCMEACLPLAIVALATGLCLGMIAAALVIRSAGGPLPPPPPPEDSDL
jgi:hypothetical protein